METTRITLPKITLIGKCGSSKDGKDFVRDLWTELNKNFSEISYLAKWDESGALKGLWGAMSDESLYFKPWEGGYDPASGSGNFADPRKQLRRGGNAPSGGKEKLRN